MGPVAHVAPEAEPSAAADARLIAAWTIFSPRDRPRVTHWEAFNAGWRARTADEPSAAWRADVARGVRLIAKHASGTVSLQGELLSFEDLLNIAAREIAPEGASAETEGL